MKREPLTAHVMARGATGPAVATVKQTVPKSLVDDEPMFRALLNRMDDELEAMGAPRGRQTWLHIPDEVDQSLWESAGGVGSSPPFGVVMTAHEQESRVVRLVGGPADGHTVEVQRGTLEVHTGGPDHVYRPTADDRDVWAYIEGSPVR